MKTCNTMQSVIEKLCAKHGVDPRDPELYLKLKNPPYQPLIIEAVGQNMIAVQHYVRDGYWNELIPDPDQVFVWFWGYDARSNKERWFLVPVSLQLVTGSHYVASRVCDGKVTHVNPTQQREQKAFATFWAKNITMQGWLRNGIKADRTADPASPD